MSSLLTEENFRFAVSVLLPGFVALATFMMAFRTRLPPTFFIVVLSVILSFFYGNALATVQDYLPLLALPAPEPVADMVNLVLVPALAGYSGGVLWERLAPWLRDKGIPVRSPIPTAWDYAFAKRSNCWVLVRFKDKDRPTVRAHYTKQGFAGTDLAHPDLYLTEVQELCEVTLEDGTKEEQYRPVVPDLAVWIAGSEIHSIEFEEGIPLEVNDDGQKEVLQRRLSAQSRLREGQGGALGDIEGQT